MGSLSASKQLIFALTRPLGCHWWWNFVVSDSLPRERAPCIGAYKPFPILDFSLAMASLCSVCFNFRLKHFQACGLSCCFIFSFHPLSYYVRPCPEEEWHIHTALAQQSRYLWFLPLHLFNMFRLTLLPSCRVSLNNKS